MIRKYNIQKINIYNIDKKNAFNDINKKKIIYFKYKIYIYKV